MGLWLVISFVIGLVGSFLVANRGFDWGLVDSRLKGVHIGFQFPKAVE